MKTWLDTESTRKTSFHSLSEMKTHVKIVGYIYCAVGALILLFFLLGLLMRILESAGITNPSKNGPPSPGFIGILSLMVFLCTIALWFFRIGMGLLSFNIFYRMVAIIMSAILFVVLNVILLWLKDPPSMTLRPGFTIFHFTMIAIGLYSLVVLAPTWGRRTFQ